MQRITFEEFKSNWENDILKNKPDYIRKGQSLMNYLAEIWFEEYQRLSSTDYSEKIDCFYVDALIPNTLNHLEKLWKN